MKCQDPTTIIEVIDCLRSITLLLSPTFIQELACDTSFAVMNECEPSETISVGIDKSSFPRSVYPVVWDKVRVDKLQSTI